jgi:hypothetical protein
LPATDGQGAEPEINDGSHGVTKNDPSAFGQQMGMNSPDFRTADNSGAGGQTTSGDGQSGGNGGGTQGGSPGQQGADGNPGSTAGGGTGSAPGTFGGQMNGPIGGSGGAISRVQNPQGRGISPTSDPSADPAPGEELYIPPAGDPQIGGGASEEGNVPGQAAPGEPRTEGLEGRASPGGESPQGIDQRGTGVRAEIRTPYREVYGEYAQQATQALESTYIPADAKEYVKEYFTELGK